MKSSNYRLKPQLVKESYPGCWKGLKLYWRNSGLFLQVESRGLLHG